MLRCDEVLSLLMGHDRAGPVSFALPSFLRSLNALSALGARFDDISFRHFDIGIEPLDERRLYLNIY